MKLFTALSALFFSVSAMAFPTVGDQSVYDVQYTQGGQTMTGSMILDVVAVGSATYSVKQTINMGGSTQVATQDSDLSGVPSAAQINEWLKDCTKIGAMSENLVTPAGAFTTCHQVYSQNGTTQHFWIANVPFDFAQNTSTDASSDLRLTLRSYHAAK